jgi:hypothetical protein
MLTPTRFAGLPRAGARLCMLALLALTVLGLCGPRHAPGAAPPQGEGDFALYRAVVTRVSGGEPYHAVAVAELGARGYAVNPALNVRLPTLATALSLAPPAAANVALLGLLAAAVLAWTVRLAPAALPPPAALFAWSLTIAAAAGLGALGWSEAGWSAPALFHEVWASLLVLLSLAVWRAGRWGPSLALGLLAALVRELALPYLLLMAALAAWEGRRREALAWAAGTAAAAAVLALHLQLALAHGAGHGTSNGWLGLGGWSFVLATAQWALFAQVVPTSDWAMAILVPLAFLGLAGWRGPLGIRAFLLAAGYAGAFLVMGRPDNHYWGLMYAQLLVIGLVLAGPAMRDLVRRSLPRAAPEAPFGRDRLPSGAEAS